MAQISNFFYNNDFEYLKEVRKCDESDLEVLCGEKVVI
jgi:hypothetical protein